MRKEFLMGSSSLVCGLLATVTFIRGGIICDRNFELDSIIDSSMAEVFTFFQEEENGCQCKLSNRI
jgi:hypothetical protein